MSFIIFMSLLIACCPPLISAQCGRREERAQAQEGAHASFSKLGPSHGHSIARDHERVKANRAGHTDHVKLARVGACAVHSSRNVTQSNSPFSAFWEHLGLPFAKVMMTIISQSFLFPVKTLTQSRTIESV